MTAKKNVPDIQKFGDPDMWQSICKASSESEGWMKSTKAMQIGGPRQAVIVQVSTQQRSPDGSHAIAEALAVVEGGAILTRDDGRKELVRYWEHKPKL